MPGKHTAKEKRQAKHIIVGYKKRGKDSDTAKHIAWATVNKQKNESTAWMVSGSTSVFLGNPDPVSQFNPSSSTSPGMNYIPDEVAKQLVKESGLRKSDTVSKKVIEGYLESMGLSRGLAVDVAKVLRDVYGITPTFDESLFAISGNLIQELTGALNESFPMPFAFDDEPKLLNEVDLVGSFLQREFMESTDEGYDTVIGHLAMLPLDQLYDVVDFHEWVGADTFNQIEEMVANGQADVAEMVIEGLAWPSRIKLMPEHVQDLFEDAVDDVIKKGTAKSRAKLPAIPPVGSKKPPAPAAAKKPGFQIPKIKAKPSVPSAKVQLRKHGQDLPGDSLAAKKPGDALAKHREKQDKEWGDKLAAAKARHASEPAKSVPKPGVGSALKKAGSAAVGLMKKIHTPSAHNPDVGPALKKIAGKAARGAGKAATGVLGAIGHGVGALAGGLHRGFTGRKKTDSDDGGEKAEKPGLAGHLGRAIGKFAHHVKQGFKNATPGIQSQMKKDDDEPKKKKQIVAPKIGDAATSESAPVVSGNLIEEVEAALSGKEIPDDPEPTVRTPAEVVKEFKADTVVDMAVIEAIAEMDWDEVAKTAGFMMLVPDHFLGLINALKEGTDVFRAEWNELEESGKKPEWMNMGSFITLSKLSLDEGVVPRIVYWAGMALQAADEAVASYVAESYPELGQTVYGPAGDPKEGPQLAKAYMTPQPAGTMTPTKSDCTTRMFSDPAEREKARKAKLSDVMDAINSMKSAAAERGVPPEGMFLNLYRDMHRERVRYS